MIDSQVPLLARQPILDKHQKTVGYELLSRPVPNATPDWQDSHGDQATSEVIINAFNDLGIENVTGGLPAFVNFTQYWLENPPILGCKYVVAELLEHLELTDTQADHIRNLRDQWFQIALDDFTGGTIPATILELVDIIKVDLMALDNIEQLRDIMASNQRPGLKWLAEKVETREEFEFCTQSGCDLFQGFFFAKPDVMYGKKIPDNKLTVLKLLRVLNNPDSEVDELTRVIQADPQISSRILQMVNAPTFAPASEITSISRAVMTMGLDRLKSWSNMLALGQLDDKPVALQEQAVTRACLARQLAELWPDMDKETAFTVGLFSLLDAFVDVPLKVLCEKLHLPAMISEALLNNSGELGEMLNVITRLEQADWSSLDWAALEQRGLSSQEVSLAYYDALIDARDLISSQQ